MFFKKSIDKIKAALVKTKKIAELFQIGRKIDEAFLEDLEERLIMADVGLETTKYLIDVLKSSYKDKEIQEKDQILTFLKENLKQRLTQKGNEIKLSEEGPTVILVIGVNGSGKTTSIAKLANHFVGQGKKVLLGAGDTFRAAAIDQLEIWANRIGIDIIKHKMGADPAAVAFDTVQAALARDAEIIIIDTAGRLHTQKNLMKELQKIHDVLQKKIPSAPHEVLLILDATIGQNAITQAELFSAATPITGIFLSKLDGTAKGGVVLAIQNQLDIPVKFIGLGEKCEDMEAFDSEQFVDALLSKD
ncbi:signal recognition particle-docking protein FtsY [Candidatus Uabimicrobium sp. HlEnr_7]|uniref:signal recognition particle-docking protein FtsY n=1 Tax=Candidatus Uabimicrobium helgolandensis TaxID=3095367 RepID=UPI003558D338